MVLEGLPEEDKQIITLIDGKDLNHPVKDPKATQKDNARYYGSIMPKIERNLEKIKTDPVDKEDSSKQPISKDTETLPSKETTLSQTASTEIVDIKTEELSKEPEKKSELTKEEYIKILELIKTPTFMEIMTQLNPKSAVIIALRFGYIDGKYFSTESIAKFLDIEESEVRMITQEILVLYKNTINNFVDKAVSYVESENQIRKLTPQ